MFLPVKQNENEVEAKRQCFGLLGLACRGTVLIIGMTWSQAYYNGRS